jgi:hypothetical protein
VTPVDWGSSEAHIVPHFELIEVLTSSFNLVPEQRGFRAFLAGYGIDDGRLQELRPELNALLTVKAVNKLRWASARAPGRVMQYQRYLRRIADYVLSSR